MVAGNRNLERLERKLMRLRAGVSDPTQANRQVSIALQAFVIRNFQLEGRLVAGGWAPLAPATIKEKRRIGKEKKLVRTGDLKNSFTPFFDKTTAGVGSDLSYAASHQFGLPERNLPARSMIPSPKQTAEISIKIYEQFIVKQKNLAELK